MIDQLTVKNRNMLNKAWTVETAKNSKGGSSDIFKQQIVTQMADRLEISAKTTFGN